MGKASKERRRLERLAKFQPQEFSSFAELASFTRQKAGDGVESLREHSSAALNKALDRASTAFSMPKSQTVASFTGRLSQLSPLNSARKEPQTMSTSRMQSFVSTVFKGKGATAMSGKGITKRWPVLGAMVVALTGALGYYGYNKFQGQGQSGYSAPTYQYQTERPAQQQAPQGSAPSQAASGSSFFSSSKVAEALSLRKANPDIKRTSHGNKAKSGKALKKKQKQAGKKAKHGSKHAMKKKGKGHVQKVAHKKKGHKKSGHLAKKKANHQGAHH